MAKVNLRLLNIFELKIKKKSLEYEGKTVGHVVSKFIKDYKDKLNDGLLSKNQKKLNPQILILLKGKNIVHLNKYKTKLNEGDVLYLSIPLAGG